MKPEVGTRAATTSKHLIGDHSMYLSYIAGSQRMVTKDDGGNIFYPSEFLGDSLIKTAINQMA